MTTFSFNKGIDDIEQPKAIEEDWYVAIITKSPEIAPNNKKKDGLSYEDGAGDNLVVSIRLEDNNRAFKLYFPWPSEEDENTFDGIGMKKYDSKMEKIINFCEKASGCTSDESDVTILPNGKIGVYVQQQMSQAGDKIINSIEHFKKGFLPPDQVGSFEEAGEDNTEAIPF